MLQTTSGLASRHVLILGLLTGLAATVAYADGRGGHDHDHGHHDRSGPFTDNWATSWNFSHQTTGCSQASLVATGWRGAVLLLRC